MTTYVKGSELRKLDGKQFTVKAIFNPYLSGWVDSLKKFRTFVRFPARLTDSILTGFDESWKPVEGDMMVWREKIYNKETRQFEFHRVEKVDREFFKLFKKVYDIEVITKEPTTVSFYNKETKSNEDGVFSNFILQGVGVGKVKGMLEAYKVDKTIDKVKGKDKTGKEAMVMPFDWEELVKDQIVDKFYELTVRGEGMDTKYSFEKVEPFDVLENVSVEETNLEELFA